MLNRILVEILPQCRYDCLCVTVEADARRLFRAAAQDDTPVRLEVAAGDWIDSRELARRALRMLERGEFAPTSRMTMR